MAMETIQFADLSSSQWMAILICGLIIGMSKTGLSGLGMAAIPIMALIFGGKSSVGILLPMLIVGDVLAVLYFRRYAEWKHLYWVLPWLAVGILIGTFVGNEVNDTVFKNIMGVIILASVGIMVWRDVKKITKIPSFPGYTMIIGLVAGFATMIGNLAGPIAILYLLSIQLKKNAFIGTAAWFYLIANVSKVPLHIWVWETINWSTFLVNLTTFPIIAIGAFIGVRIVLLIPEVWYRRFVISVTLASALLLVF